MEIEKGRRKNLPRPGRTCKICKTNQPEDEIHFTLLCPALSATREPFIEKISKLTSKFTYLTDKDKIKYLFFNESLPHKTLETSSLLLETLIEKRQFLINSQQHKYLS